MSQATVRSESTRTLHELVDAIRRRMRAVLPSIKRFAAGLLVLGAMLVVVMAIKLVQIAVANPAVANALTSGMLFF